MEKWERGMRRHCYKALSPFFVFQGFLGNCSRDLRRSEFSDAVCGPLPGPLRNCSPWCWFYAAASCYSPNNRRLLRQLLRLSNCYCTAIPSVFSPQLDSSNVSACGSGTGCLLGCFFTISLFLTLAPCDSVTYCQARGLSGHTSPCGEYALSLFGPHLGTGCLLDWFFYYSSCF